MKNAWEKKTLESLPIFEKRLVFVLGNGTVATKNTQEAVVSASSQTLHKQKKHETVNYIKKSSLGIW